ncbi:MAG: RuvX/YqgF family protein [Candidatus Peregrinibacteria bacterium]
MDTVLALDIGGRRTGVAFFSPEVGIPMPLATLSHASEAECASLTVEIVQKRHVGRIFIGLPLLPSGQEGKQAGLVRSVAELLQKSLPDVLFEFIDERYTTPKNTDSKRSDPDAEAACEILRIGLAKDCKRSKSPFRTVTKMDLPYSEQFLYTKEP